MSVGEGTTLIGKQELLQWACQCSGVPQCMRYDDLKDGFVLLCLAERLWPALVDTQVVRNQRRGARTSKLNWEIIKGVMTAVGLPTHLCDPKGVAAGHQRPCYNLLVMFFFLSRLATSSEFSVDFAHPIDETLAAFLQSPDSLQCLSRGQREREVAKPVASAAAAPMNAQQDDLGNVQDSGRSVSPAHPAPSPNRRAPNATPKAAAASSRGYEDHSSSLMYTTPSAAHPQTPSGNNNVASSSSDVGFLRAELSHIRKAKELQEQEIAHIKVMSRHTLEQQRALVDMELARASGQLQQQLLTAKLETEFEVNQTIASLKSDYDMVLEEIAIERSSWESSSASGNSRAMPQEVSSLRQANTVLQGKVQALEVAAQRSNRQASQYKEVMDQQKTQMERVLSALQAAAIRTAEQVKAASDGSVALDFTDRLSSAEKAGVVHFIRQMQLDMESQRTQLERLREELAAARSREQGNAFVSAASVRKGDGSLSGETGDVSRYKVQLDRLKAANQFLHEQLKVLRRDDGTAHVLQNMLQSQDTHATQFESTGGDGGRELVAATPIIGLQSIDVLCANVFQKLQPLFASLPADQKEMAHSSFWELAVGAQILGVRLQNNSVVIRDIHNALVASQRQVTIERHRHAKELRDQTEDLREDLRQATTSGRRALNDVELELKLSREEVAVARRELPQMMSRMQRMTVEMVAECERLMEGPRERNKTLTRQMLQLRSREQQWTQVAEYFDQATRASTSAAKTSNESQARQIMQQLQGTANSVPPVPSGDVDSETVHNALLRLRELCEGNVRRVFSDVEQFSLRSDECVKLVKQISDARAEIEMRRTQQDADAIERRRLEHESTAQAEEVHSLRSEADKLRLMLDTQRQEAERSWEETVRLLEDQGILVARARLGRPTAVHDMIAHDNGTSSRNFGGAPPATSEMQLSTQTPYYSRYVSQSSSIATAMMHEVTDAVSSSSGVAPNEAAAGASSRTAAPPTNAAAAGKAPTTSILTPEELERRKQEILSKYRVKNIVAGVPASS